ncbi:hypothetical protein C8Q80DRAFT_1267640 [Daedaleopsis nitida]|nr:hypothetical protein C8Q80DRAFT_1267640 [Daedaleopsis nitida]
MTSPDDASSKLKTHLKVYEDLLRDQAAEIASLKAEVAYLKKQLVEPQNEGTKADAAQLQAKNTKLPRSPPASSSSSRDQDVIELEDSEEETSRRTSPAKRPKKRDNSQNGLADLHRSSRRARWFADESPKKKPKLTLEVVIPRLTPQRLSSYTESQATSAATATNQVVLSSSLDEYDDWDLSSLSSLPSTPSRPGTPAPGEDYDNLNDVRRSPANHLELSNSLSAHKEAPRQPLHTQDARSQSSSHKNSKPGQGAHRSGGPHADVGSSITTRKATLKPPHTPRPRIQPPALPSPTSPTSPQRNYRLAGAATFEVAVADPALLRVAVNRKQTSSIFGGSYLPMCVRTAGRDFLYPRVDMNPLLPRAAGRPGLIYRGGDGPGWHWKGDVQTLFVGVRNGEYKYFGEYRMALAAPLSAEEYCALSYELKKKWAKGMTSKSKYKDIRVRIMTRRDKGREATAEEIARVVANKRDKYDDKLTIDDIIDVYTRGEERLFVWRMECVNFDEAFLKGLVSKL